MNFSYLHPRLIAGHTGTLVLVLIALLGKDDLGAEQRLAIAFIGASLPVLALAFIFAPQDRGNDQAAEILYLWVHPLAHSLGAISLALVFRSLSVTASNVFIAGVVTCGHDIIRWDSREAAGRHSNTPSPRQTIWLPSGSLPI